MKNDVKKKDDSPKGEKRIDYNTFLENKEYFKELTFMTF